MKRKDIVVLLTLLLGSFANGEDIRDSISKEENQRPRQNIIAPDRHIFGIPYGVSEDEFISKFGKPNGYVQLTKDTAAMIYGQSTAFLFTSGKFDGIRIHRLNILDWRLTREMKVHSTFDNIKWELENGIKARTSRKQVSEILNQDLSDQFRYEYETDTAIVSLQFNSYSGQNPQVSNIMIKRKENQRIEPRALKAFFSAE